MKIKEGQIFASYCDYLDRIDIILIAKKHPDLEDFFYYQYEWIMGETPVSIMTEKHLNNWKYIGDLE